MREDRIKLGFQGKAAIYLPETSRYDSLAALPAGTHVGEAIGDAMIAMVSIKYDWIKIQGYVTRASTRRFAR